MCERKREEGEKEREGERGMEKVVLVNLALVDHRRKKKPLFWFVIKII